MTEPPPSSVLDDDIFDSATEPKTITELDLGTSTDHVQLDKKQTLNDDLFFSTISDPVDETTEAEDVIEIFQLIQILICFGQ